MTLQYRTTCPPVGVHPLVEQFYELLAERRLTQKSVSLQAGFSYRFAHDLRKSDPSLYNFDALLAVLGLELAIVPLSKEQSSG